MKFQIRVASVVLCLIFACVSVGSTEDLSSRVYVLDSKPPGVSAISLENGQILGTAPVAGNPRRMVVSPDGRRVIVLDKGKGKQTVRFGYHPKAKSMATVIDTATMEVVANTELGWSVSTGDVWDRQGFGGSWSFSSDSRYLTIACFGYRSQKPRETLPAELVTLDLQTGVVVRRLEVERPIDSLITTRDASLAVVYSPRREGKKKQPSLDAALSFVDLTSLELLATVSLKGEPGSPILSPDGGYLYLLETGKPDKKPEKHINGRVQVVSMATREYEVSLDVGSAPRGITVDEEGQQVFVLSDSPPTNDKKKKEDRPGLLHVIRSGDKAATLEVGYNPLFVKTSPDREIVYAVSEESVAAADLVALRELGGGEMEGAGISWLTSDGGNKGAVDMSISSDGKRGYVLFGGSSKVVVYDLLENEVLAELTTGRGGVKFAKFLGAAAATASSAYAGSSAASASGSSYYTYNIYGVRAASTTIVFGPEEKFVYVLNTQSNDVTIIDAATNEMVDKIGVGGDSRALIRLPGGLRMAVRTGKETLHLIDTATLKKLSEHKRGGNFVISPDERHAVAVRDNAVLCMDGSLLERVAMAQGTFKKLTQLAFPPMEEKRRRFTSP